MNSHSQLKLLYQPFPENSGEKYTPSVYALPGIGFMTHARPDLFAVNSQKKK